MRHCAGISHEETDPDPECMGELHCRQEGRWGLEEGSYGFRKVELFFTSFKVAVKPDNPLSQILTALHSKNRGASQGTEGPQET
jgi:hypothetical protein